MVDDRGLTLSETSPRGNATGADPVAYTTDHVYDELGRLVETRSPSVVVETRQSAAATARPTTTVGYDTFGQATDARGPNGEVVHTVFDGLGREVDTTLPDYTPPGATTPLTPKVTRAYDAAGNLASETDPLGKTSTFVYDQLGNLAKVTRPAPTVTASAPVSTFTYDLLGEQLSATDPTGARTEATYDDLGRAVTSTVIERRPAPGAFTTKRTYDDTGNVLSTTTPTGLTTSGIYNVGGQPTSITDPAGAKTVLSYGPTGRPTSVTTAQGRTTRTTYDLAGRTTAVTDEDAAGTVLRTRGSTYDADGNPIEVTDALGHTVKQTFDAMGRLTKLVEPVDATASLTTTYGYDAAGNRTRLTDGRSHTTWYDFTSHGLLESVVEPSTTAHPDAADRTWTTVYDAAGRPVKEIQPGSVTQDRTFDALDRITQVTGAGAEAPTTPDTFGYDPVGRLVSASAPGGTDTFGYDDRGNLLSSDGPSGTATFAYDEEGRLTGRTDAAGQATFVYDMAGRLKSAVDPLTQATRTYGYDATSRLTSIAYGGTGASRTLAYDILDRLSSDTLKAPGGTTTASSAYSYDEASQLTGRTTAGTAGSGTQSYGYDWTGRLTSWTAADGSVTDYAWDAAGNRTGAGAVTAVYDERNRLLSAGDVTYTYSARGTRTGSSGPGGSHSSAFDAHGRMVSADGTAYGYDALGRLVKRGTDTLGYADQTNNLVAGGGQLVFRDSSGEALSTANGDGTGAAAVLSNLHGDVTGSFDPATGALGNSTGYSPFGEVTARTGAAGALGYQGEYTDPSTGQVNMHARWYDPANGGFSSRDSWTLNPVPSIQANRYTYGNGSPLLNTDPSGHSVCLFGVCTPKYIDDGIRELERHANAGVRYVKNNPRSVIKFGIRRFPVVSVVTSAYDFAEWLRRPKESTYVEMEPWYGDPDPGDGSGSDRGRVISPVYEGGSRGGGGGGGGGTGTGTGPCGWYCIPKGPPPPPPPPPWEEILATVLAKEHARPAATATTDSEHDQFVDDAYTRSLKDLELTAKQLKKYFRFFPTFQDDAMRAEEFKNFVGAWNDQSRDCMKGQGNWAYYHPLDPQGRATGVTACLTAESVDYRGRGREANPDKQTEIMGSDTARGRGTPNTNPAGWQYLDGEIGFARGHLLGRQLGGNGRDRRNLVKMYNTANSEVMAEYEGIVRRRLDGGERIFYVSVPQYDGSNPMPDSIELYALGNQGFYGQWTVHNTPDGLPPMNGLTP
ncbi:RHS repeat-associated core domain-containing protein [Streptomyces sp. NPDC056222]|uniref:RHS repeat-associated core domain-containing protein n=1 Tax=Streptomyces sp. NPDC056222 TaxID=3345749 RepID=UPI0035D8486E